MEQLLGAEGFTPLGFCFKWDVTVLVLTVVGNMLAAAAFLLIPLAVLAFLRRGGHYKSFHWIFYLFASASFAGAAAHAVKIWNVYHPAFMLEAGLDFYSGVAFLSTAVLMWPLIPRILALPHPEQMDKAYDELKAEMIRRESAEYRNRQLASIVESSNDAIVSFMLNGTVLSWNRGAQELFGYSVESTMGKAMRQLIGPDMDTIIEVLRDGRKLDTIELPYTTSDGRQIYLSLCVSPIKDAEGKVVSGAAIFRDITQMKQAEKDLVHASAQLSHSNKELEDFAWVAAHDLKEPVRTMATYSKLLSSEYESVLDEQGQQFLKFIHRSSIMAMARIDDVLKFSAVRREKFNAHKVDLNDLLVRVTQDLNSAIRESHAKIDVPEPLPAIQGKSEYVSLLLQNVLSNAIKYSEKEPHIVITAEPEGEFWHIKVKDNGIGFEQEHAATIFQMFQRLHSDDKYSGTGLGLAMCKKIVELHGGKIWAESAVGEGTTFHFTLPVAQKPSLVAAAPAETK
jgi:PAS domain S-box-containing protein